MKEEIDKYFDLNHESQVVRVMEKLIKFEFPKIKNLSVGVNGGNVCVRFEAGKYTPEEILNKVNEYKTMKT